MARYTEALCRLCRRGVKLFLKGDDIIRISAVERRKYPQRAAQKRRKNSLITLQLRKTEGKEI
jgi:hypothetical protein